MFFPDKIQTNHFLFVNYSLLTEKESHVIWEARNHPEIRRLMDNPNIISWDDHQDYVQSLASRLDRIYYACWHKWGGQFLYNRISER